MEKINGKILVVDDAFVGMLSAFEGKLESVKQIVHITDQKAAEGTHHFDPQRCKGRKSTISRMV